MPHQFLAWICQDQSREQGSKIKRMKAQDLARIYFSPGKVRSELYHQRHNQNRQERVRQHQEGLIRPIVLVRIPPQFG